MRRIFSFVAFILWSIAALANLLSLDVSLALRSTFPTLIASSVLTGLFFILFSWRAFVSFTIITNIEKQPKVFVGLITMILLGLFVISYAIKDRELPGKYGECSVLLRPIYFNPYVQNKINATLKKSPGYIRAGVISFEALCAKSKKHQRQVFLDPNTSLEEQKSLILELTGLEKLMETYQKRLDSALRGEDPNQHQFHYKEDVINPALEKHLGELQQDMEALESKIQTTKTKAQELQLATKAYFEKTFHKVKKYFETL